jgi:hypothetical protein
MVRNVRPTADRTAPMPAPHPNVVTPGHTSVPANSWPQHCQHHAATAAYPSTRPTGGMQHIASTDKTKPAGLQLTQPATNATSGGINTHTTPPIRSPRHSPHNKQAEPASRHPNHPTTHYPGGRGGASLETTTPTRSIGRSLFARNFRFRGGRTVGIVQ